MYSVKKGFTLVEIAISTTLFAIIIIVVYSSFNLGLGIWRDRLSVKKSLQPIRVGLLKMEKELKSTFPYSGIPFKGTKNEISFPLVVSKEDITKIDTVTYYIEKGEDSDSVRVLRKEAQNTRTILEGLDSASFNYAFKSSSPLETFLWKEDFDGEKLKSLPKGIRVSLVLKKEGFDKIISIPQGELISE